MWPFKKRCSCEQLETKIKECWALQDENEVLREQLKNAELDAKIARMHADNDPALDEIIKKYKAVEQNKQLSMHELLSRQAGGLGGLHMQARAAATGAHNSLGQLGQLEQGVFGGLL